MHGNPVEELEGKIQIGDYVIAPIDPKNDFSTGNYFAVRMAGAEEHLSFHKTEKAAKVKVKLYQAADKRRHRN